MDALEALEEKWDNHAKLVTDLRDFFDEHFREGSVVFLDFLRKVFNGDPRKIWEFISEGDETTALSILEDAFVFSPEMTESFIFLAVPPERAEVLINDLRSQGWIDPTTQQRLID